MIKKKLIIMFAVLFLFVNLKSFAVERTESYEKLKYTAFNTISETLFDKKIHPNLKLDIIEIISKLLLGENYKLNQENSIEIATETENPLVDSVNISILLNDNKKNEHKTNLSPQLIEFIRKSLNNDNEDIKFYIIDLISKAKAKELLPDIINLFNQVGEDKADLKSSIIMAIGKIGTDNELNLLNKYIDNSVNLRLRLNAIQAIGEINTPKSIELIKKYLKSDVLEIALLCAGILADSNNPDAIKLLDEAMNSPYITTKQKALIALTNSSTVSVLPILKKAILLNDEGLQAYSLGILGNINSPESVNIIQKFINNDKLYEKSLDALGKLSSPEAFKLLDNCMLSDNNDKKFYILSIMAKNKNKNNIPTLKLALNDDNEKIRVSAAKIIHSLDDDSGLPILKSAIKSNNEETSLSAAMYLGYIGDKSAENILKDAINNSDLPSWKRLDASIILDKLGNLTSLNNMEDLLKFQRPNVLPTDITPSDQTLKKLLNSNSEWIQLNAAFFMLNNKKTDCLSTLEKLADSKDTKIRTLAIEMLGKLNNKEALPILEKHLNDEYARVRIKSSESIIKILIKDENQGKPSSESISIAI